MLVTGYLSKSFLSYLDGAMSKGLKGTNILATAEVPCPEGCTFVQQLMTCVEIGKALTSTLNIKQILVIILRRLNKLIKAKNWTLFLLDPQTRKLHFEVVVGLDKTSLGDMQIRVGEGIAGTVALTGEPMLVPDVRKDPRFSGRVDHVTGFITRSVICLPLKLRGSIIGVLEVVNPKDASLFRPDSMPVLSILADYVAIASFGIVNYPHDAANQRDLLHIADSSMYRSKALGKDSITLA